MNDRGRESQIQPLSFCFCTFGSRRETFCESDEAASRLDAMAGVRTWTWRSTGGRPGLAHDTVAEAEERVLLKQTGMG